MINKELLLAAWLEKLQKKWDTEEYYYDVEEAKKVFKFVSKLTNDRGASRNFDLLEFQFEIITEILCVKRRSDGKRKHREAHINIPRKNGKSFLAAIIVVYLFFCQRHIFGALFILTANTTKQAGELYGTVEHFIKANKTLRRYCKITSSTKTIIRKDNGNKLMVLSTGAKDWRDVKKIIDGVLPTLRGRVVVITNLSGSVYLKSQEDKNGRNLDLVKEVNGKEYFQGKELITLSDEDITASATEKVIFYVVNLYALVKFFERKGYTVSTDKSVFFESDELALKVQERFDCEKLDDRADFKIEFAAA